MRSNKVVYKLSSVVLGLVILEFCSRLIIAIVFNVSFFNPSQIIYLYYPQVKNIKENYNSLKKDKNILILSSSTLVDEWGDFEKNFQNKINDSINQEIKVFNASGVGFSSMDNLISYQLLNDLKFDYIFIYTAINDMRFNNCNTDIFKSNYSHAPWNEDVLCILKHKELNFYSSPFLFHFLWNKLKQNFVKANYIPNNYKDQLDWQKYGNQFISLTVYKRNIEMLLNEMPLSTKKLLISFCYYSPEGYSFENFVNRKLDYNFCQNSRETEVWGEPQNVTNFIESCNNVLSNEVNKEKQVYFYNVCSQIDSSVYFADICHYSPQGIEVFTLQNLEILKNFEF